MPQEPVDRRDYPRQFTARRDSELAPEYRWLPALYRSSAARLDKMMRGAERQFPGIFERLDAVRQRRVDEWPDWCWMPIGIVAQVLIDDYAQQTTRTTGEMAATGVAAVQQLASLGVPGDAARLAALGAWRYAGRHTVYFHPSTAAKFEEHAGDLPRDLPNRWPLAAVYMAFEATTGSRGLFLHLEWDAAEQRTELRLLLDTEPVAGFGQLQAQPVFLDGSTVAEALSRTWAASIMRTTSMFGSDEILDTSAGGTFDTLVRAQLPSIGVWVAAADTLASSETAMVEAAQVLDRSPAGQTWPPAPDPAATTPLLWLAADRSVKA